MSITEQGNFEDVIKRAGSGGWASLEGLSAELNEKQKADKEQRDQDARDQQTVANAFKAFASTPEGEKAIQFLCDQTINKQVFLTYMGWPADQVAIYGAHREGANQLMYSILKLIADGEGADHQPKSREAKL